MRRKALSARDEAVMITVIGAGEFGLLVPTSPRHTGVAALSGCESATLNCAATELGFAYSRIEFEAEFTIDIRGRLGNRAVRPHFQTVSLREVVDTAESEEPPCEVVEETEARCPVFNLLRDAKVELEMHWLRRDAAPAPVR